MSTHLYLAPAAAGKTTYALSLARTAACNLAALSRADAGSTVIGTWRVVVATHLQARAARRRLAEMGGAAGVRILTFDRLYSEVLNAAGEVYVELGEPVQYRLIRAVVDSLALTYYAPLAERPGFIQVVQRLISELKAARVHPDTFLQSVQSLGDEPRLRELAQIYATYQMRLQAQGWADRVGMGWLAVETLNAITPATPWEWPLLVVDGFDSFTPIQAALLQALADRVGELVITLTGDIHNANIGLAHRRFARTRAVLEKTLGIQAEPLSAAPYQYSHPVERPPTLVRLAGNLFQISPSPIDVAGTVDLLEAPECAGEVRAALRWLKTRIVQDGCRPGEVALLARNLPAYGPFIPQIAAELGLPIRMVDGLPLAENPAVAALLDLLRMMLPLAGAEEQHALPRRAVIAAWRSPYFDWSTPDTGSDTGGGIETTISPGDAERLDEIARRGRVIGGETQWLEALNSPGVQAENFVVHAIAAEDEERGTPSHLDRSADTQALRDKFTAFLRRVQPPVGKCSYRDFVAWLEALIGADDQTGVDSAAAGEDAVSLRVVARTRAGTTASAERDIAALVSFKDVLRGLVWAEEALHTAPVDFPRFCNELAGALAAGFYQLPLPADREEILVANVIQARGLSLRAVAILGLAEGEFPATLREDPFLRDSDRIRLRDEYDLPLDLSTEGAEAEFFYEAITRPAERLLLTRPRLADNGATWQASPYWEAVQRQVNVTPLRLTSESAPRPDEAASWPELLESLAQHDGHDAVRQWAASMEPARVEGVAAGKQILLLRRPSASGSPFDGDLSALAADWAIRFAAEHSWSASRLESYQNCPFAFFIRHVLGLEPRQEPTVGADARQLGNIYHTILAQVHGAAADPTDLDALLAALPQAAKAVLAAAPQREGFRAAAWWPQTCAEITANVQRSLEALAERAGDFRPLAHELIFRAERSLTIREGEDAFRVHGYIDRIDRAPDGSLQIIDYKLGGSGAFKPKALAEGKKLQLPIYALAAVQALRLGPVVDGFYWHVQQAEASKLTLGSWPGGPAAAIATALAHAWTAVRSARMGQFTPQPPDDGCPDTCPAAAFCWRYRTRR